MNQVLHKSICLVFGVILLHLSSYESEATVYKWKDRSGKIHFTDEPNRVPEEFRKEYFKRNFFPPISKSKSPIKAEEKSDQEKEGVASESKEDTEKEESKKDEELTAAEKSAAEAIIAFFEEVKASGVNKSHAAKPTKINLFVKISFEILCKSNR